MSKIFLSVALPVPVPNLFDYLAPEGVKTDACQPGMRLRVSFGKSKKIGIIVRQTQKSIVEESKVKKAEELLDKEPLLTGDDIDFLIWISNYYHFYIGEVISLAIPPRLRKYSKPLSINKYVYFLKKPYEEAVSLVKKSPRQKELLKIFYNNPEKKISFIEFSKSKKNFNKSLDCLIKNNILGAEEVSNENINNIILKPNYEVNKQQQTCIDLIKKSFGKFNVFLLEGITGSGKTEVYIRSIRIALSLDKSIMILVPEISLTPQLRKRFSERLGCTVSVMHSGMNSSERETAWQRVRLGYDKVVLGTRSIIFSSIKNLGLIIVDEEHDPSFKQMDGFRYSARDLSVIRAKRANCPVILGSATPSLESIKNAITGRYKHVKLTERAGSASLPKIKLVKIKDQPLRSGLSEVVLNELKLTLDSKKQAIVFLNRRGYAPALTCYDCNWISSCTRCDSYQTLHRSSKILWCHHCGSQRSIPERCPECGQKNLETIGQGTEQIESFLKNYFPQVPLVRIDRDSTKNRGNLENLLSDVQKNQPAILVGTQMLAKGHHFPMVTFVAVMDVDGGLFSADFRSTERMAQLLMQVAGRSGRGQYPGQVFIQTRHPEHPLLQTLIKDGYTAFALEALKEREEANLPPYSHQALLRVESNKNELPLLFLQKVSDWISELPEKKVEALGPIPAPMMKKMGHYRAHLLIQSPNRELLHPILKQLKVFLIETKDARKVRWSLDIDPNNMY